MYSIKMSGKTLKFDIVEFSKKEFHASELCISWKWFVMIHFFVHIKMSYYWFNRQGLLQIIDIAVVVKKKLLNIILTIKKKLKKEQIISIETR